MTRTKTRTKLSFESWMKQVDRLVQALWAAKKARRMLDFDRRGRNVAIRMAIDGKHYVYRTK